MCARFLESSASSEVRWVGMLSTAVSAPLFRSSSVLFFSFSNLEICFICPVMPPFHFYLQKLVCKRMVTKEKVRSWKLDTVELWTVQRREFWVMKSINTVIQWPRETFSCLHEIRGGRTIWDTRGRPCGVGGRTSYWKRVIQVKFPLHILLHAYNMFLNKRLFFFFSKSLI